MRCTKAKKIISDYLDGCLSRRKASRLEAHLQECSDCAKELEELRKLSLALQEAGRVEASEEYWENYWGRLNAKLPQNPTLVPFHSKLRFACIELLRKPVPAIYTIIVVLLVGMLVYFSDFYLDKPPHHTAPTALRTENDKMARGRDRKRAKGQRGKGEVMQETEAEDRATTEGLHSLYGKKRSVHSMNAESSPRRSETISSSVVGKKEKNSFLMMQGNQERSSDELWTDHKDLSLLYGLIIRVLKLKCPEGAPKTQSLVVNVPKGNDLDRIFLAEFRKENSKTGIDFDFLLSSKAVTVAEQQISVSFRSGDFYYTLKLKPEKKGKLSYSANYFNRQALLKAKSNGIRNIALPQIGETVRLKLSASYFFPNELIVLLTRFEPLD